jgi:hypothetical protein
VTLAIQLGRQIVVGQESVSLLPPQVRPRGRETEKALGIMPWVPEARAVPDAEVSSRGAREGPPRVRRRESGLCDNLRGV